MASRSEGLESGNRPCLRAVSLVVLAELGFDETLLAERLSFVVGSFGDQGLLKVFPGRFGGSGRAGRSTPSSDLESTKLLIDTSAHDLPRICRSFHGGWFAFLSSLQELRRCFQAEPL